MMRRVLLDRVISKNAQGKTTSVLQELFAL